MKRRVNARSVRGQPSLVEPVFDNSAGNLGISESVDYVASPLWMLRVKRARDDSDVLRHQIVLDRQNVGLLGISPIRKSPTVLMEQLAQLLAVLLSAVIAHVLIGSQYAKLNGRHHQQPHTIHAHFAASLVLPTNAQILPRRFNKRCAGCDGWSICLCLLRKLRQWLTSTIVHKKKACGAAVRLELTSQTCDCASPIKRHRPIIQR